MIENATAEIAHTPAASPSTPSEKFTMFISSTSAERGHRPAELAQLDAVHERQRERVHRTPDVTSTTAAAICRRA